MKRSLVLVTVDCLRADHVGFLGYSRPVTPFLDSIAKSAHVFSNAMVAGVPTYFSFPAIMASRHPLALGRDVLGIASGECTLATALREAGYETGAFVAGNPYLTPRFGYEQGFAKFQDFMDVPCEPRFVAEHRTSAWARLNRTIERMSNTTSITAAAYDELYFRYCHRRSRRGIVSMDQLRRYPSADVIVDAAVSWIESLENKPFFLWIHLMDPHHPYYPNEEAQYLLSSSRRNPQQALFLNSFWNRDDIGPDRLRKHKDEILDLYDAGVRWVDFQLGRLADALKKQQRWDDSIFVVTADHGEEFLENGRRYHSPIGLPECLVRVPLLIRGPGLSNAKNLPDVFSLVHLAPTLLDAVGVAIPKSFKGKSSWKSIQADEIPQQAAIVECLGDCNNPWSVHDRIKPRLIAVRDKDYKLVIDFSNQLERFYRLKNDPLEENALPESVEKNQRRWLYTILEKHLQDTREQRDSRLVLQARFRELRHELNTKGASVLRSQNPSQAVGHG